VERRTALLIAERFHIMGEQQEDTGELRLGAEFESTPCLSNAEVCVVLQEAKARLEEEDQTVPEVFEQTLAYATRFAQIKDAAANKAVVEDLHKELASKVWERVDNDGNQVVVRLADFELASLINLKPEEYEEAVAVVPSLDQKLSESDIQDLLDKINRALGRAFAS